MTQKNFRDHSLGYFKFKALRLSKRRSVRPRPNLTLPAAVFVWAVMFLAGVQFGSVMINRLETRLAQADPFASASVLARYEPVLSVSLPANLSFLEPLYDRSVETLKKVGSFFPTLWSRVVSDAARFFGSAPTPAVSPELLAQIKREILLELEQVATTTPKDRFGLVAVPSTGSTTQDESIKINLQRLFADQVDVRFDTGSSSGVITPIFRDGRRGADYVFVLTPAQ